MGTPDDVEVEVGMLREVSTPETELPVLGVMRK